MTGNNEKSASFGNTESHVNGEEEADGTAGWAGWARCARCAQPLNKFHISSILSTKERMTH